MAELQSRCRCCGVPVEGLRAQVRVCPLCDQCDGLHGDRLQIALADHMLGGRVSWGQALCRMMIDDALITGRIVFVACPHGGGAHISIPNPPQRWEVVCARAVALDELPDVNIILQVVIAKHVGTRNTKERLEAIGRDLRDALSILDPNIIEVTVSSRMDALEPGHLIIDVKTSTPAAPGMVTMPHGDVEIPSDIMTRARGQA